MRAAVLDRYSKEGRELSLKDVPVPTIGAEEVLVRVLAAGVNPLDNI